MLGSLKAVMAAFLEDRSEERKERERRLLIEEAVLEALKDRHFKLLSIQDIRDALESKSISTSIHDIEVALKSIRRRDRKVRVYLEKRYLYHG